jgi:hypothetical protein
MHGPLFVYEMFWQIEEAFEGGIGDCQLKQQL